MLQEKLLNFTKNEDVDKISPSLEINSMLE